MTQKGNSFLIYLIADIVQSLDITVLFGNIPELDTFHTARLSSISPHIFDPFDNFKLQADQQGQIDEDADEYGRPFRCFDIDQFCKLSILAVFIEKDPDREIEVRIKIFEKLEVLEEGILSEYDERHHHKAKNNVDQAEPCAWSFDLFE